MSLEAAFATRLDAYPDLLDGRIGIAVSGGSDSLALMHLLRGRLPESRLHVVTVDHGLRAGSATEARLVAERAAALDLSHQTLRWEGWDGRGNLQDQARRARMRLIADWAQAQGVDTVALGHTRDDQAETLLMRLGRGTGLDGLTAMSGHRRAMGVTWLRPLLAFRRTALRDYLRARQVDWVDDPSNEDPRFDRVRIRQALTQLEPLGITIDGLAETAGRLAEARAVLDQQTHHAAVMHARVDHGDLVIDRAAMFSLPAEIRRRLLAHAVRWVSSSDYAPRAASLAHALEAVAEGRRHSLHGCLLGAGKNLRISREPAAVLQIPCDPDNLWDNRWRLRGPDAKGKVIRALGTAGIASLPQGAPTKIPYTSLCASPAVWEGDHLVAAPVAGMANGWTATLEPRCGDFAASVLSH